MLYFVLGYTTIETAEECQYSRSCGWADIATNPSADSQQQFDTFKFMKRVKRWKQ